jgi:hypothetical protein
VPTFTFVALAGFLVLTLPSLGRGRRIIGALTVLFPVRALMTIAVPLCLSIGAVLASTANCALRQATISGCSQVDANFNSIPLTVDLGSASSFELLGGAISNTGTSIVVGNVGATSTVTGFPPGTATGFVCTPTSAAPCTSANNSAVTPAYNQIFNPGGSFSMAQGLTSTQSRTDLSGSTTFTANSVNTFSSPNITTGTGIALTFDAANDSSAGFVIEIASTLTAGPIHFNLINGAQASNIFWIVGTDATISPVGFPIVWDGDIIAGGTFTISSIGPSSALGGIINGCVFSTNANTLAGTTEVNGCSAVDAPEPGSAALVGLGLPGGHPDMAAPTDRSPFRLDSSMKP